jgi:hypothetical protein
VATDKVIAKAAQLCVDLQDYRTVVPLTMVQQAA